MKPMFVKKRWGWGITPGDWRGWFLTAGYVLAVMLSARFLEGSLRVWCVVALTLAFVVFAFWAYIRKL